MGFPAFNALKSRLIPVGNVVSCIHLEGISQDGSSQVKVWGSSYVKNKARLHLNLRLSLSAK